jgi:hypothetical protein
MAIVKKMARQLLTIKIACPTRGARTGMMRNTVNTSDMALAISIPE